VKVRTTRKNRTLDIPDMGVRVSNGGGGVSDVVSGELVNAAFPVRRLFGGRPRTHTTAAKLATFRH